VQALANQVSNVSKHVAATAHRLKLIQIDFADESPDVRQGYLSEEVERALGEVVPDERREFLRSLMDWFPTWDPNVDLRPIEMPAPTQSKTDADELGDPSFLVTRLTDVAATLSDAERQAIIERLREAGLAPKTEGGWPEEAVQRLRQSLQIDRETALDPERTLELVALAADFASNLDQLVWRAWQKLGPKSSVRSTTPLRTILKQFVTGDQAVPRGQVVHDVRKLRQLIAALVAAAGMGGQFAARYLARYSPAEIEAIVRMEGVRFLKAFEVRCWDKYKEMAAELSEAAIENEVRESVAEFAEQLMKGLGR